MTTSLAQARQSLRRRWWLVALVLPPIQEDLGGTAVTIAWVVNAYVLCFGGLMLLGGRIADRWAGDGR